MKIASGKNQPKFIGTD